MKNDEKSTVVAGTLDSPHLVFSLRLFEVKTKVFVVDNSSRKVIDCGLLRFFDTFLQGTSLLCPSVLLCFLCLHVYKSMKMMRIGMAERCRKMICTHRGPVFLDFRIRFEGYQLLVLAPRGALPKLSSCQQYSRHDLRCLCYSDHLHSILVPSVRP